jgi:hypothetical protein
MSLSNDKSTRRSILIGTETKTARIIPKVSLMTRFFVPLVLLISVLSACGGQKSDEPTADQSQSDSYPSPEATDVNSSDETIGLPQATLRFKDQEGWSWQVSIQGGPLFLNAVKTIEKTSPPGKATGEVVLNPYNVSFENLDQGKVAPEFNFSLLIGLMKPTPPAFYGQALFDGCYTQGSSAFDGVVDYVLCEIGWVDYDGNFQKGFHMLEGPTYSYELDEYEEATIDSWVSFLNSPARAIYITARWCDFAYDLSTKTWTAENGCEIVGQLGVGSSTTNEVTSDQNVVDIKCDSYYLKESLPFDLCERGNLIMTIQQILNDLGFSVEVDGYYGPQTFTAVAEFQRQEGIEVTGTVDRETFEFLGL